MAITKITTPEIFDLSATNTSLKLPTGDTASRPTNPSTGEWRYNTTLKYVEYYDGSTWRQIQTEEECTTNIVDYPTGATCIAYYKLDYSATDETTNNHDGTPNDITYVNGSPYSQAAVFNGSSSKITAPSLLSNSYTGSVSFSLWFKTSNTDSNIKTIIVSDDTTGTITGKVLLFVVRNSVLEITGYNFPTFTSVGTTNISDGNWHNVVLVLDNSNATLNVYLDGNSSPEITKTLSSSNLTLDKVFSEAWTIGSQGTIRFFDGDIDQVRIYSTALTSSQVTQLYEEVQCPCTTNTIGYSVDAIGSSTNSNTLAYYKLDGSANDSTANAYNGTWAAGKEAYSVAPYGTGGLFNGSSTKIVLPVSIAQQNNYTFSAWFKTDSSGTQCLYSYNNPSSPRSFIFLTSGGTKNIRVFSQGVNFYSLDNVYNTNQWYHIAYTKSSTDGILVYLDNNIVIDDSTYNPNPAGSTLPSSGTSNDTPTTQGDNRLGGYKTSNESSWFDGDIDQVRIFSTPLSASKVTDLYEEVYCNTISTLDVFGGSTGVALYQFENNANSTDSSTYNGTWGGTEAYAGGYFDKAAVFNGSSSYIQTASNSVFISQTFTVSAWINSNSNSATQVITSTYHGSGADRGWWFRLQGGKLALAGNTSGGNVTYLSPNSYSTNTWFHAMVVKTPTSIKLYENGQEVFNSSSTDFQFNSTSLPLTIGRLGILSTQYFNGKIDQVRIFNTALTEFQVLQLYSE